MSNSDKRTAAKEAHDAVMKLIETSADLSGRLDHLIKQTDKHDLILTRLITQLHKQGMVTTTLKSDVTNVKDDVTNVKDAVKVVKSNDLINLRNYLYKTSTKKDVATKLKNIKENDITPLDTKIKDLKIDLKERIKTVKDDQITWVQIGAAISGAVVVLNGLIYILKNINLQ